jgi:MoaA/NifB/PqqE/SkfB family radical SAM enzyme
MANLIIADVCNMACPYCFAGQYMSSVKTNSKSSFISLETFEKRLDFLDRSNINSVRLLGGEPTLHPQFVELVRRARLRHKIIVIFSNGVIPEPVLQCLESLPVDACRMMVNMNASRKTDRYARQDQKRQREVLQRLGQRAFPGYTIFSPDFQLDPLLQIILESGCRKKIRVGLAQPMLNAGNMYLRPKQYPLVGQRLVNIARAVAATGIKLEPDCGFVRCMFSDEDFEYLRQSADDFGCHCNAILDIGLDDSVIHCLPLSGQKVIRMGDDTIDTELRNQLNTLMQPYRSAGVYKECSTCPYKSSGVCTGGCLSAVMQRFHQPELNLSIPASFKHALSR